MAAVVGLAAILAAAEFPKRADERARRANSIEIARRWDQEPFLWSRSVTRGLNTQQLAEQVKEKGDVHVAMIHMGNYYWEIAEAVQSKWADDQYIRQRFRETLIDYFPAFDSLLREDLLQVDSSALTGLAVITKLHLDWTKEARASPGKGSDKWNVQSTQCTGARSIEASEVAVIRFREMSSQSLLQRLDRQQGKLSR